MAVGKGSMARASKAAATKAGDSKATVIAKVEETVAEVMITENKTVQKEVQEKNATKKTAAKKTAKKQTAENTSQSKEIAVEKERAAAVGAVVEATSEQVMKQIVYQKSAQVLDREPKANETFGIGEAMPIYMF